MKKLLKTIFVAILILVVAGCNVIGKSGGHFTNQVASIDEPQTDDERTLVGEYKDFLLLVDSLAEVWESNDTLSIRRLYYNQREQWKRTEKAMKFQNVRHSLVENIGINMDNVRKEINQKLSPEFRSELYDFYEFFDLKKNYFTNLYGFGKCKRKLTLDENFVSFNVGNE